MPDDFDAPAGRTHHVGDDCPGGYHQETISAEEFRRRYPPPSAADTEIVRVSRGTTSPPMLTLPAAEWRAMAERITALTAERDETRRLARVAVQGVVGFHNGDMDDSVNYAEMMRAEKALRIHLAATEDADHV